MEKTTSFLGLLQSLDAFFPVGAFTLSNGLEDYVIRERITCIEDLEEYIHGFMCIFPYQDLVVASLAYRFAKEREQILYLDHLAAAMKVSSEVRGGSVRMCRRYIKAREAMQDLGEHLSWYQKMLQEQKAVGIHAVALGLYAAEQELQEALFLQMYGYSVLSAIVNNAVKLVPLSQMEGQRVLFEALGQLPDAAKKAGRIAMEELGISAGAYDLHCMNHEQLYSRQYIS